MLRHARELDVAVPVTRLQAQTWMARQCSEQCRCINSAMPKSQEAKIECLQLPGAVAWALLSNCGG